MSLPLLLERVANDPTIKTFGDLAIELTAKPINPIQVADRLTELQELQSIIADTIKHYEEHATNLLVDGMEVRGMKLSTPRKTRKVTDQDQLIATLVGQGGLTHADIYETKLKGIPALEKALKNNDWSADEIEDMIGVGITITEGKPSAKFS